MKSLAMKWTFFTFVFLAVAAMPLLAGPVPSKTAANQSLEQRAADLTVVREVVALEGVSDALAAQGFTREEIDTRLASLSNEELSSLAHNLNQIEAAGLTREQWIYVGIGALAALLLVVLL